MLVIEFCGYVGNDAEIKEFNGQKFISFNVATSERYKDAQGNTVSRTTWVSCLKPGESAVVQYLKKGTQVFVRGDFSAKTFTGANGVQVGVNCRVRELQLLGTKQDAGQQAATQAGNRWHQHRRNRKHRHTVVITHSEKQMIRMICHFKE